MVVKQLEKISKFHSGNPATTKTARQDPKI